jgi:hypothetical protein
MLEFSDTDIDSVFDYLKNNPNATKEQWLVHRSSNITEQEINLFGNKVSYAKVMMPLKGKEYELLVLRSHTSSVLHNFISKVVGNRGYYKFIPYDNYGYFFVAIAFAEELFFIDDWRDDEKCRTVKLVESEDGTVKLLAHMEDDVEESGAITYFRSMLDARDAQPLYLENDRDIAILANLGQLDYKNIRTLFKSKLN